MKFSSVRDLTETESFIGADLKPVIATCDTLRMAAGEPGLPREFIWSDQTITILVVLRSWHETSRCRHGSSEQYVSKHWYEVETVAHGRLKIYFDRQGRLTRRVQVSPSSHDACFVMTV